MLMAADPRRVTQEPGASNERMAGRLGGSRMLVLLGPLALCLSFVNGAAGQSAPPFMVQSLAAGLKPLGVAVNWTGELVYRENPRNFRVWAAVANSGDNSVSVFVFDPDFGIPPRFPFRNLSPSKIIRGVPSPFAVSSCESGRFLVTSPSANSVSLIDAPSGTVLGTFGVGQQPYSADCTDFDYGQVIVSNYGDSSLSVISVWPSSFGITRTIPNVPGSRGLHGVASASLGRIAWVAGTDADVVTKVDVNTSTVVLRLPVRRPTLVYSYPSDTSPSLGIASSFENSTIRVDTSSLQITGTRIVPTPQDLASSYLGSFISSGPGTSLTWISVNSVATIPAIQSPLGLAAWNAGWGWPNGLPTSPPSFVLATSPDSNTVYFIEGQQAPPPAPSQFSIVNGASFARLEVAPGSLASIFAATGVSQNFSVGSLPAPTSLGGVALNVGGSLNFDAASGKWTYSSVGSVQAPLFFVGPSQINLQVPPGIALAAPVVIQLTRPDGSTLLTTASFASTAPGIFTLLMNGQGQAAVLNQENTVNFGTNPARRGSVIQIFATGAGETTPALAAGEAAPAGGNPLVLTKVQPTVTIGGKNAKVQFSGMAPGFVGLWQINAEVPADVTPGFAVPLVVTAAGATSNTVTIAVQ